MTPTYTIVGTSGDLHHAADQSSNVAIDDVLGRAKISFIVQQLQLVNNLVLHEPDVALSGPVI